MPSASGEKCEASLSASQKMDEITQEGSDACRCSALLSDAPAKSKGPRQKRGGGLSMKKKKNSNNAGEEVRV